MMCLGLSTTPGLSSDFAFAATNSVAGSGSLTADTVSPTSFSGTQFPQWTPKSTIKFLSQHLL